MNWNDYTSPTNVLLEMAGTEANIANSANLTTRIARLITAASRVIDRWCLVPDGAFAGSAQTRFFDILPTLNGPMREARDTSYGESGAYTEVGGPTVTVMGITTGEVPHIAIDPLLGLPSEVAVDSTLDGTFASIMTFLTDFDLWPINAYQDGYPYQEIRWLPATALIAFPIGQRTLRIKGLWGYQTPSQMVQSLSLTGAPTGGTFTLSYGGQTTAPIAFDAQGKDVQDALAALSTITDLTGNYQGTTNFTVTDGQLPSSQLQIIANGQYFTGLVLGSNNLTGGTTPTVVLSSPTLTGPSAHPAIEQATIFQVIKWLKEPEAAPLGMAGSVEMGFQKVQPSDSVIEILEDGHFVDHFIFV